MILPCGHEGSNPNGQRKRCFECEKTHRKAATLAWMKENYPPKTKRRVKKMKAFDEIKKVMAEIEADVAKADKGNKAAGVRARAGLMRIKQLAHDGRAQISAATSK